MSDPLSFEETLAALQGLLAVPVTVFVGGSAAEPGIVAVSAGVLASAAADPAFDELYPTQWGGPGEAIHFRVEDDDGSLRLAFVVYEPFFHQAFWSDDGKLFYITQGDAPNGVAITIRRDA